MEIETPFAFAFLPTPTKVGVHRAVADAVGKWAPASTGVEQNSDPRLSESLY
jgi:hypothetical protein